MLILGVLLKQKNLNLNPKAYTLDFTVNPKP